MSRKNKKFRPDVDVKEWTGKYTPYDIIKEGTIAVLVVALLTVGLAALFGSPDETQLTLRQWSQTNPTDFAATAFTELNGTSGTATYGPPYNNASEGQQIGPLKLAKWAGVRIPIDTVKDFVLLPLESLPPDPVLTADLNQWNSASTTQQTAWTDNYAKGTMGFANGHVTDTATNAGPVPMFIDRLTSMARAGGLDQALVTGAGFYTTNFTQPLLFLSDGGWFGDVAATQHLSGDQWGMMNETGSYPGQAWLWLYTFWYQIEPFKSSSNADALVFGLMGVLTAGMIFVPFIPGLRSIPRWTRVYRLIWREHYKNLQ